MSSEATRNVQRNMAVKSKHVVNIRPHGTAFLTKANEGRR